MLFFFRIQIAMCRKKNMENSKKKAQKVKEMELFISQCLHLFLVASVLHIDPNRVLYMSIFVFFYFFFVHLLVGQIEKAYLINSQLQFVANKFNKNINIKIINDDRIWIMYHMFGCLRIQYIHTYIVIVFVFFFLFSPFQFTRITSTISKHITKKNVKFKNGPDYNMIPLWYFNACVFNL